MPIRHHPCGVLLILNIDQNKPSKLGISLAYNYINSKVKMIKIKIVFLAFTVVINTIMEVLEFY